jgi:hypothetical protein
MGHAERVAARGAGRDLDLAGPLKTIRRTADEGLR